MLENALERRNYSFKLKITVKTLVSLGVIALAVVLPQLAHLIFGESAGVTLLPMYLPVLLGGCLLGWKWGVGVGMLSPLFSYLVTSAFGSAMPAQARLPFMMAELTVFAVVRDFSQRELRKKRGLRSRLLSRLRYAEEHPSLRLSQYSLQEHRLQPL